MDQLYEAMANQLAAAPSQFIRYKAFEINWSNRMLGLVGPRGVGKTTLFLQHIRDHCKNGEALYASADNLYFATHSIYDTAAAFSRANGKYLFLDEVHKYEGWSRELKAIYDSFPDLHIYFTGSSVLDIEKGDADLSRRAPRYEMQGMSFREFLNIRYGINTKVYTLEEILCHEEEIPNIAHPLPLFKEYLKTGYYPFGTDADYFMELNQAVSRTLDVDMLQYANMTVSTSRKLKKLLGIMSTLVPFKPNATKLASQIGVSRNSIEDYLVLMEKAGLISILRACSHGLGKLGKTEKVYLDNSNLLYALNSGAVNKGTLRETFFFNQMRVGHDVYASSKSDFEINGLTFEVAGHNKTGKQILDVEGAYIVKDDIEKGYANVIPLWAFGLCY